MTNTMEPTILRTVIVIDKTFSPNAGAIGSSNDDAGGATILRPFVEIARRPVILAGNPNESSTDDSGAADSQQKKSIKKEHA